jgi:hypothetical protein
MRDLLQIPDIVLRKSVKALNKSGVAPKGDIVTLKKEDMVKVFAYQVEHVPEDQRFELPGYVIELYNYIFEDEAEKKILTKYKYLPKMSVFGSREGTQAYIIDDMFLKGGCTLEEMARACNTTKIRVKNHMNHIRCKFKKKFVRMDNRYYMRDKDAKDETKKRIREIPKGLF